MKELKIFKNYGCLAAEKRIIYTYGAEAESAIYSDEITVSIPEGWRIYETIYGGTACESPWGDKYNINDLLEGNKYPYFTAYDNTGKLRRVQLEVIKE